MIRFARAIAVAKLSIPRPTVARVEPQPADVSSRSPRVAARRRSTAQIMARMGGINTVVNLHDQASPPRAALAQNAHRSPVRRNHQKARNIADEAATTGISIVASAPWASRLGL